MIGKIVSPRRRTSLGQAATTITVPSATDTFISGITASPWLYIGGGLLLTFLVMRAWSGGGSTRKRRRSAGVSSFNAALFAAGAGALGYLAGSGTLGQLGL
jgi:hypothetical protein